MFTQLFVLGAALIITTPALAASGSGGPSSGTAANANAAGGHGAGASVGGGGSIGAGHGAGLGAHSAAMSTHLGGAGHPLHGATAHAVTGHLAQSQRLATVDKGKKKPDLGHDDTSRRLFLHRTAADYSPLDWTSICLRSFSAVDGRWWSDCNRPAKSSSNPHI